MVAAKAAGLVPDVPMLTALMRAYMSAGQHQAAWRQWTRLGRGSGIGGQLPAVSNAGRRPVELGTVRSHPELKLNIPS